MGLRKRKPQEDDVETIEGEGPLIIWMDNEGVIHIYSRVKKKQVQSILRQLMEYVDTHGPDFVNGVPNVDFPDGT